MDEFTKSNRFTLDFECTVCGKKWNPTFPEAEVERYITHWGTRVLKTECEECRSSAGNEYDEDEEN